jgi:ATP-dependent Clp protease ATP-binding subunit ClpC
VLFDEIEKAHEAIFNVLLQIMDEGQLISGRGEVCSFNEAVILLTSNIGAKDADKASKRGELGFCEVPLDRGKLKKEIIDKCLEDKFPPEFRNRLTEIIHFNSLDENVCSNIIDVLLKRTSSYLKKAQNIELEWDDTVVDYLVNKGYSFEFGARNLERTIQQHIELPLAKNILLNKYTPNMIQETPLPQNDDILSETRVGEGDYPAKIIGFDNKFAKAARIKVKLVDEDLEFNYLP